MCLYAARRVGDVDEAPCSPPAVFSTSPGPSKSSLYCMRHEVLPDNEFEAAKGLHVEDIDCSLIVRPTRTALDLSFFGEVRHRERESSRLRSGK